MYTHSLGPTLQVQQDELASLAPAIVQHCPSHAAHSETGHQQGEKQQPHLGSSIDQSERAPPPQQPTTKSTSMTRQDKPTLIAVYRTADYQVPSID